MIIASIVWFLVKPGFSPLFAFCPGVLTCYQWRPKDWLLIQKRSVQELPDQYYEINGIDNAEEIDLNTVIDEDGGKRFNWGSSTKNYEDQSVKFAIENEHYTSSNFDRIPIKVVMITHVNSHGIPERLLYSFITDRSPVCFSRFDAVASKITLEDIDNDEKPELIVGYKIGGHTEAIKIFKLDENLNFNLIDSSSLGSDYPLITWNKNDRNEFCIKTYGRNWTDNRNKWHSRFKKYIYRNNQFKLEKTSKVKWQK